MALAAALAGYPALSSIGKFAPCGIYEVSNASNPAAFKIVNTGDQTLSYITVNSLHTTPWGFQDGPLSAYDYNKDMGHVILVASSVEEQIVYRLTTVFKLSCS